MFYKVAIQHQYKNERSVTHYVVVEAPTGDDAARLGMDAHLLTPEFKAASANMKAMYVAGAVGVRAPSDAEKTKPNRGKSK